MAEEALRKVNEEIRQQARLMGYDDRHVPQAQLPYYSRADARTDAAKAEARKLADTRLAALRAGANKGIEQRALASRNHSSSAAWKATRPRRWSRRCRPPRR